LANIRAKFANVQYEIGMTKLSINRCLYSFPILESPNTKASDFANFLRNMTKLTDHSRLDRAMREYFDACSAHNGTNT
jgi:hypothetical protein